MEAIVARQTRDAGGPVATELLWIGTVTGHPGRSGVSCPHSSMPAAATLVVGQAMIEHGLLDSLGAAWTSARYTVERSLGDDPMLWVAVIAVVLVLAFLFKRR